MAVSRRFHSSVKKFTDQCSSVPVVCVSSLAEERSACPSPTPRSSPTLWTDHGKRVGNYIGCELRGADGRKKAGKPRDQRVRRIDSSSAAVDGDVKLGSGARKCLSIRRQGQAGADEWIRRWKGFSRDVVTALVNQETWRAAGP